MVIDKVLMYNTRMNCKLVKMTEREAIYAAVYPGS